jgi:putative toxin-antitoxin system antitoxin component (TIGR02293 family)
MAIKSSTREKAGPSVLSVKAKPEKSLAKRSTKRAVEEGTAQPRVFSPERAGPVLRKWSGVGAGAPGNALDALGAELRLARTIAAGLPTRAVDDVIGSGLVEPHVIYEIVVPRRTLADRKQKEKPLSPEQSDRLARVLRVYARAEEAIGDLSRAYGWLHKENRALTGKRPIDLLGSDAGARAVEKVLGRIEHGIVS